MPVEKAKRKDLNPQVERELWGRAAGRCSFRDCNRPLYKSSVTQQRVNLGEKAHIWSFSGEGPRGHGELACTPKKIDEVDNLILVCPLCHKTLDEDKHVGFYTAALLKQYKAEHEERIELVTSINPSRKSHVLLYGARIGDESIRPRYEVCAPALRPEWNPVDERGIDLSMSSALDDSEEDFWMIEEKSLRRLFSERISPLLQDQRPPHFSVFAFAPQPLLILLGALLTDKTNSSVHQLHRQPRTWTWGNGEKEAGFKLIKPPNASGRPVLVLSLSGKIHAADVEDVLGAGVSIWEVTIDERHNDFMRCKQHLDEFARFLRGTLEVINEAQPGKPEIAVFPAMPVSCSVELGRLRMPKGGAPWKIYDRNPKHGKFIPTLIIGEQQK